MGASQLSTQLGNEWTRSGALPPVLPGLPPPPVAGPGPLTRGVRRLWFWIIEAFLVCAFLLMHFGLDVWDWWRNGERVTGVVLDLEYEDEGDGTRIREMTILDSAEERRVVVHPDFDHPDKELGDIATVVVMPGDPSKVATPADINLYFLCWAGVPLLAVWWPLRCWRRHQMLAIGDWA